MKALARGNDLVQMRMFERLDTLLKIKVVESELAITLKEVIFLLFIWYLKGTTNTPSNLKEIYPVMEHVPLLDSGGSKSLFTRNRF